MQLYHLNILHESFQHAGIAVHAITAEPGGEATLRRKLAQNGLESPIRFPLYSDPSWTMMVMEPRDRVYVENPSHPFLLEGGQFDEPYRMCQPAMVIVNRAGEVIYWWSWSVLKSGVITEDGLLPNGQRAADNPDGNTHDVRWRPVPSDILERLTHGGDLSKVRVDNLGFPKGKDHANTKKQLRRNPADTARTQIEIAKETGADVKIFYVKPKL